MVVTAELRRQIKARVLARPTTTEDERMELVRRAIALQCAGLLGFVWIDGGRVYLPRERVNAYTSRFVVSWEALRDLVEAGERAMGGRLAKPMGREIGG